MTDRIRPLFYGDMFMESSPQILKFLLVARLYHPFFPAWLRNFYSHPTSQGSVYHCLFSLLIINNPILIVKTVCKMRRQQNNDIIFRPHHAKQYSITCLRKTKKLNQKIRFISHIPIHLKHIIDCRNLKLIQNHLSIMKGID